MELGAGGGFSGWWKGSCVCCTILLGKIVIRFFWYLVRLDDIEVELASTNLHQVQIVQLMQWEANLLLQVVTMNPPFFDQDKSVGCFRK